mmetsp:Transcript_18508/g.24020  ORF Transcript_18508/g.24020 Transcript_18508/m.24020 type:complete len:214 (+) Transcript_18508:583-1224(+)
MGYFRSALLERGVYKSFVRILLCFRVESARDQMLDRYFNRSHVTATCKIKIFIQKVSMTVLLRGPASRPSGPICLCISSRIITPFECIEQGLVGRKSLLCDHVSNQHNKCLVGDFIGHFTHFFHLVIPFILRQVRQKILRLPSFVTSFQQNVIHHPTSNGSNVLNNFHMSRVEIFCGRQTLLKFIFLETHTADVFIFLRRHSGRIDRARHSKL